MYVCITGFERSCEHSAFSVKEETAPAGVLAVLRHRKLCTRVHASCAKFLSAYRSDHALAHTLFLELMPKLKRGSGRHARGRKPKGGTKNKHQVAARDEARTTAIAAVGTMADEALEALLSPPPAPAEEVVSEATCGPEPACEPSKGVLDAYKRMAVVSAYQRLNCPPESEWAKHGGTLRQIADAFDMPDPCDYRPIKEVLLRYLNGEDVWYCKVGQGRKSKLAYGQQLIAADCLRTGTGQEQAAHILTAWRETKGMTEKEAAVTRRVVTRRPQLQKPPPCLPRSGCAHVRFSMGLGVRNCVIVSLYTQCLLEITQIWAHFRSNPLVRVGTVLP